MNVTRKNHSVPSIAAYCASYETHSRNIRTSTTFGHHMCGLYLTFHLRSLLTISLRLF
ncbi:hypothetical protein BDV34DRAFT_196430 [Aspergillus parasiticus]|uniref:Uncharacterized protein n=1 Tax=Aspergillus parasiticus TaxID=5067 RepID=A0A5N6DKJ8_ASPPA|nr:hypothetical protein BDV34DRAFT_196430 [Aspergillus parasiticus]